MKNNDLFLKKIALSKKDLTVHIVGKYVDLADSYLSVIESLYIAGFENNVKVKIVFINSLHITSENYKEKLKDVKAVIIPGGFGKRGVEGMILTAKYVRENNIPFLGICLGMQVACIEYARNVLKIKNANSTEFELNDPAIFNLLEGKSSDKNLGGTLRLGCYKSKIYKNTLLYKLYKSDFLMERHRHRYEFNNKFREQFIKSGMVISSEYLEKQLVEVIELPNHKYFIGSQFHPEFSSRPNKPSPLFFGFIKAAIL